MRIALIALVTLLIGGGVVGIILFQTATPDLDRSPSARVLADYFAQEHMAVIRAENHQFDVETAEELRIQTGAWLGRQMDFEDTLFASESGLQFIGARETHVPGPGRSVHALFATQDGAWASVFIQQYLSQPELDMNTAYSFRARGLGGDAPEVVVWRPGGQIHYLVSENPAGVSALRAALGVPEPARRYR